MKLIRIIDQANDIYKLRLTRNERETLQYRLVGAGFCAQVGSNQVSAVIDAILQTTDHLRARPKLAVVTANSYSNLKSESVAAADGICPRCHQPMRQVQLVGGRYASYCEACNVALPLRA